MISQEGVFFYWTIHDPLIWNREAYARWGARLKEGERKRQCEAYEPATGQCERVQDRWPHMQCQKCHKSVSVCTYHEKNPTQEGTWCCGNEAKREALRKQREEKS